MANLAAPRQRGLTFVGRSSLKWNLTVQTEEAKMSLVRDIFGGKKHFSNMNDEQLLDHLAELTFSPVWQLYETGVRSMLEVVFERVAADKTAHEALSPVIEAMAFVEKGHPRGYNMSHVSGALHCMLKDRYNNRHPEKLITPVWTNLVP